MDERLQFILDAESDPFTMTELCSRYGVSKRVGLVRVPRLAEEGKRAIPCQCAIPGQVLSCV